MLVTNKFSSILLVHNILHLSEDFKLRTGKSKELYFKVTSSLILSDLFVDSTYLINQANATVWGYVNEPDLKKLESVYHSEKNHHHVRLLM